MKRQLTISFHFYGAQHPNNHFDLFIVSHDNLYLEHYPLSKTELRLLLSGKPVAITPGHSHRLKYLNYSGSLGDNRGRVRILLRSCIISEQPFTRQKIICHADAICFTTQCSSRLNSAIRQ